MLHNLFRASNKFWYAMYYDELIETDDYLLSYLQHADRPYFNCAHAVQTTNTQVVHEIESFFRTRNATPAFYLDEHTSSTLKAHLMTHGYAEQINERENWYQFDCHQQTKLQELSDAATAYQQKNPQLECIFFIPMLENSLLTKFLDLDAEVNGINPIVAKALKSNLLHPKIPQMQFVCAIAQEKNIPASISLISLHHNMAFLAEGATHPAFRQRGIYTWLNQLAVCFAARQGVDKIVVNCDHEAYSNNTYKRLGFASLGQRKLFINTMGESNVKN